MKELHHADEPPTGMTREGGTWTCPARVCRSRLGPFRCRHSDDLDAARAIVQAAADQIRESFVQIKRAADGVSASRASWWWRRG